MNVTKTLTAIAAATVTALALAGCGGSADTASSSASDSSGTGGETAEIRFSWWGGDSRHEATEKAIAAFEAKYPNIKVEAEYGAWNGWGQKQSLNLSGGNGADVMQINWGWLDSYGQGGNAFIDLNEYSDELDLSQFPQESLDSCTINGKLMAVPVSLTGRLFYWNKTTFDEVGCQIPFDRESLLAAGAAFKAYDEDAYPLVLQAYDRMIFMVYYLESVYNKPWVEDGQLQYTKEEIAEGMEFMNQLEDAHVIPTLAVLDGDMSDSIDKNAKWINGKYAGIYTWDSSAKKMSDALEESVDKPGQEMVMGDFIQFGDYNGGFTKIAQAFAIPSACKYPREAAMLIDFLLNDPEGVEICGTERGIPCSMAAVKLLDEKNIGDELAKESNEAVISHCKFSIDSKFENPDLQANPDGVYYKVFGKLSAREKEPAEAAAELIKGVNECLGN